MKFGRIRSFDDLDVVARHARHVLTLFSGGLDSSYVLKELAERNCRVTALAMDVGEGVHQKDLQEIAARFGATLELVDMREEFAQQAVLPAIRAQARYLGIYPISSSLSRPMLAQCAVETAVRLGCDAIIHTANQSQNSLRRLNGAIAQLGYEGWYGTPYEFSAMTRDEKIKILSQAGLPRFQARGISGDANLWCREFESGALENPEAFWVPESLYEWTAPRDLGALPRELRVSFDAGTPVALNDERLPLQELIARLNRLAGAFGVGRYCGLEHLDFGEKVLEVREAPAAHVLMDAYRHLETATLDAELLREKLGQEQVWVREAIEGRWFGHLRDAAEAFIARTARHVTGTVAYTLRPGAADVCSIRADRPLYLCDRDGWEKRVARERAHTRLSHDMTSTQEIYA
ncbi:argininosuccinate synthase-related protein [Azohydromonas caseinilytica]|uniref:argininosuccinate synthase n=1 Tax=Azohydromonas caseinilytica TaxID=2728836 RepID=A0A848F9P4_9BURK|nr:argininosuccinate synthase-related protein [Azohydromonas caseinilytica]NML14950.1 argininosuccinate synthase [Azohydromonas caseinilytica]